MNRYEDENRELRLDKIEACKRRIAKGYYDIPEVWERTAQRVEEGLRRDLRKNAE